MDKVAPSAKTMWWVGLAVFVPAAPIVLLAHQTWAFVPFAMAFGIAQTLSWFCDRRLRQAIRSRKPELLSDPERSIAWAANDWETRATELDDEIVSDPELERLASRAAALRVSSIAGALIGGALVFASVTFLGARL